MVLTSFVLQLFLLVTGNLRRRSINGLLRLSIWLAYVSADLVAVYALGLFSQYEDKYKLGRHSYGDTLPFLWVPFLLLHLGGQDSITAFSIEDNNLWLRHLLNLGIQVALALYVFWKSFPRIHTLVLTPAIFIFVSGIIKYGERTWALNRGSRDGLGVNSRATTPEPAPSPLVITRENDCYPYALQTVLLARGLFVGRTVIQLGERAKTKIEEDCRGAFDLNRNRVEVFGLKRNRVGLCQKLIAIELGMMFDLLYTKAMVLQRWWGIIFRIIAQISIAVAFVLFYRYKKHAHNTINVSISYTLFLGAIFMECWTVGIMLTVSPWTRALWPEDSLLCCICSIFGSFLSKAFQCYEDLREKWMLNFNKGPREKWMLNSMGQFNLMDSSIAWKSTPAVMEKVLRVLGLDQKWRIFWHTKHTEGYSIIQHIVNLFTHSQTLSDHILKLFYKSPQFGRKLNYTLSLPFEHALYLLHIYTDLHISRHFAGNSNRPVGRGNSNRLVASQGEDHDEFIIMSLKDDCEKLSNYMMYLMMVCPSMLPVSTAAEDVGAELPDWVRNKCGETTTKPGILEEYGKKLGREPGSSSPFEPEEEQQGETFLTLKQSLEQIREMWVRLLIYAAGKCPGEVHARQLGNGGELLTFVWLLLLHHGHGDAAREIKLLTSDDGSVPELGSLVSAEKSRWVQKSDQPQYAFDFRRHQQRSQHLDSETATARVWREQPVRKTVNVNGDLSSSEIEEHNEEAVSSTR